MAARGLKLLVLTWFSNQYAPPIEQPEAITINCKPENVYNRNVSPIEEDNEPNSVVEVEFWSDDSSYPLTELSERTGCRIVLEQLLPGKGSGYYSYYQITGTSPDEIDDILQNYSGLDVRLVNASDEGGIFEVRINDGSRYFAPLLTEAGAILSQLWSVDGESHLLVQIPESTSPSEVIESVL